MSTSTVAAHTRADSCPGALQLHQADDGLLARVRIPGGVLAAEQFAALAEACAALGDGSLQLTSRGNVQVRGITDATAFAHAVAAAGLLPSEDHERSRNVLASVLSGRDGAGLLDVRPFATAFDHALLADTALAELPGRFLVTLDDGRDDVAACDGDLGVFATGADTVALLVSGADSGVRLPAASAVRALIVGARTFLSARAASAPAAWRVAEVPDAATAIAAAVLHVVPGAVRGEPLPAHAVAPVTVASLGVLAQRDGLSAVAVGAPLGSLSAAQAELLARTAFLARADGGAGEVIVTPWRTVVVPDLSADRAAYLCGQARAAGLIVSPDAPLAGVTACTGRPGCGRALADVRADALSHAAPGRLPVHWVGCERSCGRPRGAIEVRATGTGYELRRDGARVVTTGDLASDLAGARR